MDRKRELGWFVVRTILSRAWLGVVCVVATLFTAGVVGDAVERGLPIGPTAGANVATDSGRGSGWERVGVTRAGLADVLNGTRSGYLAVAGVPGNPGSTVFLTAKPVPAARTCAVLPAVEVKERERLQPEYVVPLGSSGPVFDAPESHGVSRTADSAALCETSGVGLRVQSADDGSFARVYVVNNSDRVIQYGRPYALARRAGDAYVPVEPAVDFFTLDSLVLHPGMTDEGQQIGPTVVQNGRERPLEPGEYLFSKIAGGAELSVAFRIAD